MDVRVFFPITRVSKSSFTTFELAFKWALTYRKNNNDLLVYCIMRFSNAKITSCIVQTLNVCNSYCYSALNITNETKENNTAMYVANLVFAV